MLEEINLVVRYLDRAILGPKSWDNHRYQANKIETISWLLDVAKKINPKAQTFLDVGCGTGIPLIMAHNRFLWVTGLEKDPVYVKAARKVLHKGLGGVINIRKCDAMKYRSYHRFDIIYFFNPAPFEEELLLEEKIVRNAKPGAIILTTYPRNSLAFLHCKLIERCPHDDESYVFLKV